MIIKKRIIDSMCVCLVLLMLVACFASCGGGNDAADTTDTESVADSTEAETSSDADTTSAEVTEETTEAVMDSEKIQAAIAALFDGLIADGVADKVLDLAESVTVDGVEYSLDWVEESNGYSVADSEVFQELSYKAEVTAPDGVVVEGISYELEYKTPADLSRFNGKKIATFGASITWYDGHPYTWGKQYQQIAIGYQKYMRDVLGAVVDNYGMSGDTTPEIMLHLAAQDLEKYDYITIMPEANDERFDVKLGKLQPKGSYHNVDTFIGAVQAGIEYALYVNPDVKIIICTPTPGWIYAPGGYAPSNPQTEDGIVTEKWANALKEIAEFYELPVCDFYNDCGFTEENRSYYMNDPDPPNNHLYSTHPTTPGFKVMGDVIIKTFADNY